MKDRALDALIVLLLYGGTGLCLLAWLVGVAGLLLWSAGAWGWLTDGH